MYYKLNNIISHLYDTGRAAALKWTMKWVWLATVTMLMGGCVVTPKQPESAAVSSTPAGSNEVSSAAAADLAQRSGPKTDFHKNATERQRFQVHIDFGRVFESHGNFDAAILEYQDAIAVAESKGGGRLKPVDLALAHRRMGGALDQLGRFAQAEVHYKKALKLNPKDSKIWNDAGYSYYLQGRWGEAEGALKTAARLAPEDERIRVNLGLTLAASGRTEEALPLLSRSTGDAIGHMNLGYLLAATGQLDLARRQYETAMALRPDLDLASRALAQLDHQRGIAAGSGAEPTLMARTARPAVDPRVNQASTAPVLPALPTPTRTIPKAQLPTWIRQPTSRPSVSITAEPRIPSLPAPVPFRPNS
jgi:Flp pilus assembly protein TadD